MDKMENDCEDPDVVIKDGGHDEIHAEVEVCSKPGCPLNSILYFYGKKVQN